MTYKGKEYNFVNEKIVGGKTYTAYRCSKPKLEIVVCGGKVRGANLARDWSHPEKLYG